MYDRCFELLVASTQPCVCASLSDNPFCVYRRARYCPSTYTSFLFSFPSPAHLSPSLYPVSSHRMPLPFGPNILQCIGYVCHIRCPSNSFVPSSVQLCDSIHPSQHPSSLPPHHPLHVRSFIAQVSAPHSVCFSKCCIVAAPVSE